MLVWTIVYHTGGSRIMPEAFEPRKLLKTIEKYKVMLCKYHFVTIIILLKNNTELRHISVDRRYVREKNDETRNQSNMLHLKVLLHYPTFKRLSYEKYSRSHIVWFAQVIFGEV